MDYPTVINQLRAYHLADMYTSDFPEEDIVFILGCIDVPDVQVRNMAIDLITEFPEPVIEKVIKLFKRFSRPAQKQLIMHFMSVEFMAPYQFLLDSLETLTDEAMVTFIIVCLGKTDYMLLPMIIGRLESEDVRYIKRLKRVLKEIGFNRLELYLQMMPQIPFEQYFRDVFGADKIDALKQEGNFQ